MTAIDVQVIGETLRSGGIPSTLIELFDELPSTNVYLNNVAKGTSHGESVDSGSPTSLTTPAAVASTLAKPSGARVCVTDWQTRGSGRRGKTWHTQKGNITFSILNELPLPASGLMGLSLVTGVAVARVLQREAKLSVELKWPNDVLVKGRKLCGLLIELHAGSRALSTQVVTGIGINFVDDPNVVSLGIGATSLPAECSEVPDRSSLIGALAVELLTAHDEFVRSGWTVFRETWARHDCLMGKTVNVIDSNGSYSATAIGVDDSGALQLDRDGEQVLVFSGDVSVRPAKPPG